MPTIAPPAEDLQTDLAQLEDAIATLTAELERTRDARDEHEALLAQACELQLFLEDQLSEAQTEIKRQRMTADIRARLLADIAGARVWQRRGAIERAVRVERLLSGTKIR